MTMFGTMVRAGRSAANGPKGPLRNPSAWALSQWPGFGTSLRQAYA